MLGRRREAGFARNTSRHLAGRTLFALVAATAIGLLFAAGALGATKHRYVGQFGGSGSGPGDLGCTAGVATDPSTGDIYVADACNGRVQIYTAGGDPIGQLRGSDTPDGFFNGVSGVAVDPANSRVYVTEEYAPAVDVFSVSGVFLERLDALATPAAAFGRPSGVAVDPATADVYVVDRTNAVVDVFDATGTFKGSFGTPGSNPGELTSPTGVAIDSASNVYVVATGDPVVDGRIEVFDAMGATHLRTIALHAPSGVAVDPANDDLYVTQQSPDAEHPVQVSRYDSSGAFQEAFGSGRVFSPVGVAVSPSSHRAYVVDGSVSSVLIFATFTAADVVTGGASGITTSQATLDGTINAQGGTVYWAWFEYGATTTYGGQTPGFPGPTGTSDVPVTDTASSLQPAMTYHYRLVASTPAGIFYGDDATFTTDAAQAGVDGQPAFASPVSGDAATLHAFVNPNNLPTQYHFEYGTTTAYGSSTADASAGSGFGDSEVTAPITGLAPSTTYHFRVVADNGTGAAAQGADATFTTPPATAAGADDVTAVSATLTGVLGAGGSGRTAHFEYGTTTAYGSSTPESTVGGAAGTVEVVVTDLAPSTTYHVRLVSTDGSTVSNGADGTFTTLPAPSATTGDATDVGFDSAMLHGTADTNGLVGTYRFAVTGVGNTVSRMTPEQPISSDGPAAVSAAIGDLPAEGAYEVRLIVEAAGAEVRGAATQFTTGAAPVLVPRTQDPPSNPYGCDAPRLNAPAAAALAGQAFTVTGSDLGVGGTVTLDGKRADVAGWSAGGVTIRVPDTATGIVQVALNCGKAAGPVALTIAKPPSNAFSITNVTLKKGSSRAVVSVKVPGAGALRLGGTSFSTVNRAVTKAGTYRIGVKLTAKAKKRLAKSKGGRLRAGLAVRFTPTGGTAATKTKTLTFKRKAHR